MGALSGKRIELSRGQRLRFAEHVWGWKPTPSQAAIMMCDSPSKVIVCGRRFGKTESGAVEDVTSLLTEPGWTSMVVAPSRDQVMINYRTAKDLLDRVPDFRNIYRAKETPHPEISIDDRVILYRTAGDDGKYIRGYGKRVRRIRVDEAAYVRASVLDGAIGPMQMDSGAELILQGTPFGKNHFYDRYRAGDPNDPNYDGVTRSFRFPTLANPHLDKAAYERERKRLGEDSLHWRCEYLAEFVDSASAVFSWDLIESCFYDPYDSNGRPRVYQTYYAGIDLGRYSDFTVVTIGGFNRGVIYVCDMDRFYQQDWAMQKSRIYDIVKRYKAMGAIDASGEGDPVVEDLIVGEYVGDETGRVRQRSGLQLERVRITSNAVKRELIDRLHVRMSQGLFKIPYGSADASGSDRWSLLVDELKYFSYSISELGRVKFSADAGRHDDIVLSLALLNRKAFGQFEREARPDYYPENSWLAVCAQIDAIHKQTTRMVIGL